MDNLVKAILSLTEQLEVKCSEPFIQAVLNRLKTFGYEATDDDLWMIAFNIQKVNTHIMNSCNTLTVPDGLFYIAVDRICGEFFHTMKNSGKLELDALDLDAAVTQITEGDTSITFDSGTSDEQRFDTLVNVLIHEGAGDEVCYRKLKW